jgi:hypothetical protein
MRRTPATPEEDAAASAAIRAQAPYFAIRVGLLAVVLVVLLVVGVTPLLAAIIALGVVGVASYPLGRRQRAAADAARARVLPAPRGEEGWQGREGSARRPRDEAGDGREAFGTAGAPELEGRPSLTVYP